MGFVLGLSVWEGLPGAQHLQCDVSLHDNLKGAGSEHLATATSHPVSSWHDHVFNVGEH